MGNSRKLCDLAEIEIEAATWATPELDSYWALTGEFYCANLFLHHQETWDADAAKEAWLELDHKATVIVALGRRVAVAIGAPKVWGKWREIEGLAVTSIPHPSGRSRAYQDQVLLEIASATLTEARERSHRKTLG
jgi:hypothetical protein